jgi:hypothetical protein
MHTQAESAGVLSVPHSVIQSFIQSVSMRDYYINSFLFLYLSYLMYSESAQLMYYSTPQNIEVKSFKNVPIILDFDKLVTFKTMSLIIPSAVIL